MRFTPLVITLATAALLAGCGGDDGLSEEEYRAQLDAACEQLTEELTTLPQVVSEEDLDLEAARDLADEAGMEFADDVGALEPPDELADAHDDLIAAIEESPPDPATPEAARERALAFAELFEAVGAEGCAAGQRGLANLIERGNEDAVP